MVNQPEPFTIVANPTDGPLMVCNTCGRRIALTPDAQRNRTLRETVFAIHDANEHPRLPLSANSPRL